MQGGISLWLVYSMAWGVGWGLFMGSEKGAMCMLFQCGWAPVCGLLED